LVIAERRYGWWFLLAMGVIVDPGYGPVCKCLIAPGINPLGTSSARMHSAGRRQVKDKQTVKLETLSLASSFSL
jgi:hypothetical protein